MKNIVLLALILLVLVSCSHLPNDSTSPAVAAGTTEHEQDKINKPTHKTGAVFHVIDPLGVQLILVNVDKKVEETILIDKTLSQLELSPGFWQVSGFIFAGKHYKIMNTSKKFVFHLKKNELAYVGSYIFQCPKVNQTYLPEMKKMNFFNRYPFSSEKHLCELVVGSDFENVNKVWTALDLDKHRPLSLGF